MPNPLTTKAQQAALNRQAAIARMAEAGHAAYYQRRPGHAWAGATLSVRERWAAVAAGVHAGLIDTPRQLREAYCSSTPCKEWTGLYSPLGKTWQAVLSAMRIAATAMEVAS